MNFPTYTRTKAEALNLAAAIFPDERTALDALRQAIAANRPTVLELVVNQELGEPFRRDALRKPKRLLAKYAAYSVE